ncbi:cytochrome P450 [Suillus ampliporus]|nr:cytochrome P450 [Suillus ampliporus]
MISLQPFLALLPSAMLQPHNMCISEHTQLVLRAAACLGIIGLISRAYLRRSKSRLPLPPSPTTSILRGHSLPPRSAFLTIAEWINEYGPLITIRSGFRNRVVVIGRYKAAEDIMETQGKLLADRPRAVSIGEMLDDGLPALPFAPFGKRVRHMRSALHTHLQPKAIVAYQPLQMSHAKKIVLDTLDDPYNFQNHVITYGATTIMKVAYGKNTPTSATDPEVIEVGKLMVMAGKILRPGNYFLVDSIPWLKYLPWYGRDLKWIAEKDRQLNVGHLNRVKEQMQSKADISPSFAKFMLENSHVYGLSESDMASLAGVFFGGGSSTISGAMCTVLMAAACFPEEQAKVQAELDVVIGRHRVPTFADQKSLPRLNAFISEALRWRPAASSVLAHLTSKDVIWENYCIPSGTTVIGHIWSISRDPEVYPEPNAFKPQRWIDDHELKFFVYGVCPGQHFANRSIFITSLLILWSFRLTLDPTQPLDDMAFSNGDLSKRSCALEFEARIPETELRHMMQNDVE